MIDLVRTIYFVKHTAFTVAILLIMIAIIDYNVGNLLSIKNMLKRIGVEAIVTNRSEEIMSAEKLILPGVGSFDYGMQQLHLSGLINALNEKVLIKKTPILGICLGAQLLTGKSEEGKEAGLGWIKGETVAFSKNKFEFDLKVPHMGWTDVNNFGGSKLFADFVETPRFYFVHSYHLLLQEEQDQMVTAKYGYEFPAGVERENVLGVQFHPEKSHRFGMKLLENFLKYY